MVGFASPRKKGTDHPKATGVYVTITVFERFWVVSPFFAPVLFFIIYPANSYKKRLFRYWQFRNDLIQIRAAVLEVVVVFSFE